MRVRTFALTLLLVLIALSIQGQTTNSTVTNNPYLPPDGGCDVTVGAWEWGWWGIQSGWMDFQCWGNLNFVSATVYLERAGGGAWGSAFIDTSYAHVWKSWPEQQPDWSCYDPYSKASLCPPNPYTEIPSSGILSTDAYESGCFRAVAEITWDTGWRVAVSEWRGNCY
jgi:hypothetical protein